MKHLMRDIAELHRAFGHPVYLDGHVCNDLVNADSSVALQERLMMRLRLVAEEFFELLEGAVGMGGSNKENINDAKYCISCVLEKWGPSDDYNAVLTADALTDLIVVIVGMALELGIPLDRTWKEVHRSNMAKVHPDGTVKKREDGKVLKPEGWTKPDIEEALKSEVTAERLKESAILDVPPEGSLERAARAVGVDLEKDVSSIITVVAHRNSTLRIQVEGDVLLSVPIAEGASCVIDANGNLSFCGKQKYEFYRNTEEHDGRDERGGESSPGAPLEDS